MNTSLAATEGPRPRTRLLQSVWARAALIVAAAEAVLIVVGVIPRWTALVAAAAVLLLYFLYGRKVSPPTLRQGLWAIAISQALVLFVPIALWVLGALVIVGLAVVAALVLAALVLDR
jgi:hypothetical protein